MTLKWAETSDGKIAGPAGVRLQISGPASQRLVHELRSRVGGILVGVNTVRVDDPLLTARLAATPRHPARFVLDSRLRTPADSKLAIDRSAATTVFHTAVHDADAAHLQEALAAQGVKVVTIGPDADGRVALGEALRHVRRLSITELLVEPGRELAAGFFASGLVDRVWRFRSKGVAGGDAAPSAAAVPDHYVVTAERTLGDDVLTEYLNPRSEAFFAPAPSADVCLI